ncbi:PREDICTED: UDP-glycosyltransferase 91C1-like [Nelumbo nucifera]|uniref:UDP-glycosyltransferase 91C1-like n=1 Tax=Nelumbo nucifera TaxID=4432 RepID=A0A1U7ZRE2_NELNU|nr:PREDICTED: UDP-glycosyltransferase 91C1-like [Nelumbo nucifera]
MASLSSVANNNELHVVMFPWLAFGHMMPFLELSKRLAERGHRVSFVSTPRNIQRLPKIPPSLSSLVHLVELPLSPTDGLPENAEATVDLSYHKVQYLKKAFDGLEGPLTRFLESSSPDWILHDFAPHWLSPITAKLGLPSAFFSLFNASALAFFGPPNALLGGDDDCRTKPEDFTVPPKWVPFPLAFRLYEILRMVDGLDRNASGVSDTYRIGSAVLGCDIVVIRSCMEFESESDCLRLLEEKIYCKPVIPVGLLPLAAPAVKDAMGEDDKWLDQQGRGSVVYVAFGSEVTLSQEDVTELAVGLELSELPFFWVLRKPSSLTQEEWGLLPDGFEERTKGRGVVCRGWAPQQRILAHPSVGGFLTHCGWSSIIEALEFGHAFILLPYLADQGLNARLLAWRKLGVEIQRDERSGSFTRSSVAESLRLVMVSDEGAELRANARKMAEMVGNKQLHDQYVDHLISYMQENRRSHVTRKAWPLKPGK